MDNVLYTHAFTDDPNILGKLMIYYRTLDRAPVNGLKFIQAVLSKETLDGLLNKQSAEFQRIINNNVKDHLNGVGIWSEWTSASCIDDFHYSPLHREFSRFAQSTLDSAWYLVVRQRGDKVIPIEVKKHL